LRRFLIPYPLFQWSHWYDCLRSYGGFTIWWSCQLDDSGKIFFFSVNEKWLSCWKSLFKATWRHEIRVPHSVKRDFCVPGQDGEGYGRGDGLGVSPWHQSGRRYGTLFKRRQSQDTPRVHLTLDWPAVCWHDCHWKSKYNNFSTLSLSLLWDLLNWNQDWSALKDQFRVNQNSYKCVCVCLFFFFFFTDSYLLVFQPKVWLDGGLT